MTSKTLLAAVTSAFLLGACATGGESFGGLGSGTGIGSSVVKMAVDSQCRTEMMQVLSPATRDQAIASVTAKTVTACFKRLYK